MKEQYGSGQPHVYLKNLSNLEIPLPKIEDQQRFVDEIKKQTQEKLKERILDIKENIKSNMNRI